MYLTRLAVFDLDRTLLDDSSSISDELERRLAAAMVPGLSCTVASGRDFEHIAPFVHQLGWGSIPVIAEQGAVIIDPTSGLVLMEQLVSPTVLTATMDALRSTPLPLNVILYGRDVPLWFKHAGDRGHLGARDTSWYNEQALDIPDVSELAVANVRKISVKCRPEHIDAIQSTLSRSLGSHANVVKADVNFINIMDARVSKGTALQWLIDSLGISAADVMAVGDCEADRSMLMVAGVPVAVSNADEQTRSLARYVVPSNNELGVAVALEGFADGRFKR